MLLKGVGISLCGSSLVVQKSVLRTREKIATKVLIVYLIVVVLVIIAVNDTKFRLGETEI